MKYNYASLGTLFQLVELTVAREIGHDFTSLPALFATNEAAEKIKRFENASDDEYFQEMVHVIFSSGLPAHLATERIHAIDARFSHFAVVANFNNHDVAEMLHDRAMKKHDRKIRRIISIAKSFRSVVDEFGSFSNYLDAMGGKDVESALHLRTNLIRRFPYLGRFTSLLFLIEAGYPILKPDTAVMRVFSRLVNVSFTVDHDASLGLKEAQILAAIRVGAEIADATQTPIRHIAETLLTFAQGPSNVPSAAICTETLPKCYVCGAKAFCRFPRKTAFSPEESLHEPGNLVNILSADRQHETREVAAYSI